MPKKTIQIVDANGDVLKGAHVMPESGNETISDSNGKATIIVENENEFVEITHVSGASVLLPFYDLEEMIHLGDNELPEVIITPKKKSWFPLLIIGSVVAIAARKQMKNQPKKVTL